MRVTRCVYTIPEKLHILMPIRILLLDHRHSLKSCAAVAMDVRVYPPGVTSSKMSAINCHGILPTSAIFLYIACPYTYEQHISDCL